MNDRGGVRSNGVIDVRSNVIEVTFEVSHDEHESGGGTGGALRHA